MLALLLGAPALAQSRDTLVLLEQPRRPSVEAILSLPAPIPADDPAANLRAGGMLLRRSLYDEAVPYLVRVTSLGSAQPRQRGWAHVQLARARLALGDSAAARADLREALVLDEVGFARSEASVLLSKLRDHPAMAGWSYLRTRHLRVHFPPDTWVQDPGEYGRGLERAYLRLSRFFGDLPATADVFVWNTSGEAEPLMRRPLGFARPEYLLVHMRQEQTPGHELVHLFSYHAGHGAHRTRFIDEGTSVAFNLSDADLLRDARLWVRLSGTGRVAIRTFWEQGDQIPEPVLYPVAGAFVRRLVDRGGREAFLRLLENQTLDNAREIYGHRLDQIMDEFEREVNR